jgi:transcription antitermination factor NusG
VGIMDDSSLLWFAIYVKNRHEKNVALTLGSKGYEAFLATYLKVHRNSKRFELPLFPGYVFCRFDASRPLPVLTTPGVFSIVSNGCVPVPIPDHEIEGVRCLSRARLGHCPWPYSSGETVYIHSGPLRGVQGIVVHDNHETWLVISIHLLERSVAVKIERNCIYGLGLCATIVAPRDSDQTTSQTSGVLEWSDIPRVKQLSSL